MVRVTTPRIAPLDPDALGPEAQKVMGNFKGETPLNIFRTLAQHPDLLRRWLVFANHVLGKSSLAPRPRELAILRIGWLCRSAYVLTALGDRPAPPLAVLPAGSTNMTAHDLRCGGRLSRRRRALLALRDLPPARAGAGRPRGSSPNQPWSRCRCRARASPTPRRRCSLELPWCCRRRVA